MKKLLFSALLIVTSSALLGQEIVGPIHSEDPIGIIAKKRAFFTKGQIDLFFPGADPAGICTSVTHMVLDEGSILGEVAYFEDSLTANSVCEIYLLPNPRLAKITKVVAGACGSAIYTGSYFTAESEVSITITDHRMRLCMDKLANLVTVEFRNLLTGEIQVMTSQP